jgi:RNA polymerase sigma-70 factor, ECF subfamily
MPVCEPTPVRSDEELATLVREGGIEAHGAFHELYERYASSLLSFLALRCPAWIEPAEVAQETWIKAYRQWHQFDGCNLIAWLITIGRNSLTDVLRRRRQHQINEEFDIPAPNDAREVDDERLAALRDCLARLDSQFVSTFVKVKIDGEPIELVAAALGVSPNTVYTRIHRGGKQLAECVEGRLA